MDLELQFEWDEEKNLINQMKHGVSFEEATEVFYDPNCMEKYDHEHSIFEKRWKAYGLHCFKILVVFFTERNGIIRIISARNAGKKEEEEYFKWVW